MNEKKLNLKNLLSTDKSRLIFIVIGLVAIVLTFLGSRSKGDETVNTDNFNTQQYQTELSTQIERMVESIDGAGEAKILLTLENSYEYVYLDDGKTLQKVNEPTIRGVVVACKGGGSAVVAQKITELLTTVLDVPSTKVCVSKLT